MMENQSIKLPLKRIIKHAQRSNKAGRSRYQFKKKLNKQEKAESSGYY